MSSPSQIPVMFVMRRRGVKLSDELLYRQEPRYVVDIDNPSAIEKLLAGFVSQGRDIHVAVVHRGDIERGYEIADAFRTMGKPLPMVFYCPPDEPMVLCVRRPE